MTGLFFDERVEEEEEFEPCTKLRIITNKEIRSLLDYLDSHGPTVRDFKMHQEAWIRSELVVNLEKLFEIHCSD